MHGSDWVKPMLKTWGRQRHRIVTGRIEFRDGAAHIDGHSPKSAIAGLLEGGSGGQVEQHFFEVYRGDGLEIWRALDSAPEQVRRILEVHYATRADWALKHRAVGCGETTYLKRLREAEFWVCGRLEAITARLQPIDNVKVQVGI